MNDVNSVTLYFNKIISVFNGLGPQVTLYTEIAAHLLALLNWLPPSISWPFDMHCTQFRRGDFVSTMLMFLKEYFEWINGFSIIFFYLV